MVKMLVNTPQQSLQTECGQTVYPSQKQIIDPITLHCSYELAMYHRIKSVDIHCSLDKWRQFYYDHWEQYSDLRSILVLCYSRFTIQEAIVTSTKNIIFKQMIEQICQSQAAYALNTGKRNWSIVGRIAWWAFLEDWSNWSNLPYIRRFTSLYGQVEHYWERKPNKTISNLVKFSW